MENKTATSALAEWAQGEYKHPFETGFITHVGTFLTRDETEIFARRSGQLEGELKGTILTSEDLW